jgi:hypothetical protein
MQRTPILARRGLGEDVMLTAEDNELLTRVENGAPAATRNAGFAASAMAGKSTWTAGSSTCRRISMAPSSWTRCGTTELEFAGYRSPSRNDDEAAGAAAAG